MIVLDTNVLSELLRPSPAERVESWLAEQDGMRIWFTTVGEAELRCRVAALPAGRRRTSLARAIDGILSDLFRGRILPFDRAAAAACASISSERRALRRPISQFDCQIAAIARASGAALATRNTIEFEHCGLDVIDPWAH